MTCAHIYQLLPPPWRFAQRICAGSFEKDKLAFEALQRLGQKRTQKGRGERLTCEVDSCRCCRSCLLHNIPVVVLGVAPRRGSAASRPHTAGYLAWAGDVPPVLLDSSRPTVKSSLVFCAFEPAVRERTCMVCGAIKGTAEARCDQCHQQCTPRKRPRHK